MQGVGLKERGALGGGRGGGERDWELLFARVVPSCCCGPLTCRSLYTSSSLIRDLEDEGVLLLVGGRGRIWELTPLVGPSLTVSTPWMQMLMSMKHWISRSGACGLAASIEGVSDID
jgi:hypothetical protein